MDREPQTREEIEAERARELEILANATRAAEALSAKKAATIGGKPAETPETITAQKSKPDASTQPKKKGWLEKRRAKKEMGKAEKEAREEDKIREGWEKKWMEGEREREEKSKIKDLKTLRQAKVMALDIKSSILRGENQNKRTEEMGSLIFTIHDKKIREDALHQLYDEILYTDREIGELKEANDPLVKFIKDTAPEYSKIFYPTYEIADVSTIKFDETDPAAGVANAKIIRFNTYHDFVAYRQGLTQEQLTTIDNMRWKIGDDQTFTGATVLASKEFWEKLDDVNSPLGQHREDFYAIKGSALRGVLVDTFPQALEAMQQDIERQKIELAQEIEEEKISELQGTKEREEAEVKREIETLSDEDKEKIGWGLSTIGFKVEKIKDDIFAGVFGGIVKKLEKRGTAYRFFEELRDSFIRDAEIAEKKAKDTTSGKEKHRFSNVALLFGNIFRYGRTISDLTGASLASPLRYVMMGGMAFTRISEAGKETRLKNEEVIEKTRMIDGDKDGATAEMAWKIYEDAEREAEGGKVSANALKDAYLMQIPTDLQKRLEHPNVANNLLQTIFQKDFSGIIKAINKIQNDTNLSPQEKKERERKLIKKYERRLIDYDRILTQYGTVDQLAMAGLMAQTAGKAVVTAVTIETIALSVEKLWENLSHILGSSDTSSTEEIGKVLKTTSQKATAPASGAATPEHAPEVRAGAPVTPERVAGVGGIVKQAVENTQHTTPSSVEEYIKAHPEQTHEIHRSWYDNNSKVFDKNELRTNWGGEHGTGINAKGEYVLDMSRMTSDGSFHNGLHANVQELLKEGKLKMLISASRETQNRVFEVPIDANGKIIVDPNSEIGKMFFKTVNGHAQFTGRFGEVGQDMGNNNFRILSTIEGSHAKVAVMPEHPAEPALAKTEAVPKIHETAKVAEPTPIPKAETVPEPTPSAKPSTPETLKKAIEAQIDTARAPKIGGGTGAHIPEAPRVIREGGQNYIFDSRVPIWDQFRNYGFGGGNISHEAMMNMEAIRALHLPAEFEQNYFELTPEEMGQVYEVHGANIAHLIPEDKSIGWLDMRNLSAREILKEGGEYNTNPKYAHLRDYLETLRKATKLKPIGGLFRGEESVGKFIARALQKAEDDGVLNLVKLK